MATVVMSLLIVVLSVMRIKTPQKLGGSGGEFFRNGSIRNGGGDDAMRDILQLQLASGFLFYTLTILSAFNIWLVFASKLRAQYSKAKGLCSVLSSLDHSLLLLFVVTVKLPRCR